MEMQSMFNQVQSGGLWIVIRENLERNAMSNVTKIMDQISAAPDWVTIGEIQKNTELTQSVISGTLAYLIKQNKLQREKREIQGANGPKLRWHYKIIDSAEKTD